MIIGVTYSSVYQKEYDFSIGVPTGNKDAMRYAMKLGFKVKGMPKSNAEMGEDELEDYYLNLDNVDETIDENVDGGVEFLKRIAFKK